MRNYCVTRPGACDRNNCCMHGKRPGELEGKPPYDPRCCHKTVLKRCPGCPYK